MAKKCNKDGCDNPVFSHNYCRFHQYLRTDKKYHKRSFIRKKTNELDLFMQIWEERPHRSEVSGIDLNKYYDSPFFPNLFAHVLSKAKWPKFRLNPDNVCLLSPQEHLLADQGTEAQRQQYEQEHNCSFQVFYDKQTKLKEEYNDVY